MKKINELTHQRQLEAQRKKEELDAKLKEVEENKRKLHEEKKRDELEKQKVKELRLHTTNSNSSTLQTHVKQPPYQSALPVKAHNYDVLTSFKSNNNPKPPHTAAVLPLKPIHNLMDNYDIHDLKSEDETDDDEEPNKPIPEWARDARLTQCAQAQARKFINYTRLFSASSQNEIILENIFKIKRKKFTERSSSAIWNSPPVWKTSGLNGNESFRLMHK